MDETTVKNKLISIYNICGISGRDNTDFYIKALKQLVNQSINCPVVVSACCPINTTIDRIKKEFGDRVSINLIKDKLTINITFNSTIRQCIKYYGEADGYSYVDSGVVYDNLNTLQLMWDMLNTGPFGMVSCVVSEDTGFCWWGYQPSGHMSLVPIGKAINGHTEIFSHEMFKAYNDKVIPDIFASYCTESIYTFLLSAIKLRWVICPDIYATHVQGIDGASSGFSRNNVKINWDHSIASRSISEIISDPEAARLGFGFEECQQVLMHDPKCFDDNGFAIYPELYTWIQNNCFLKKQEFDYDTIQSEWIQ